MRRLENLDDRNSQKLVAFVTKARVYEGNVMRFLMGEESHYSSPKVYNRFSAARSFARTTCPLALGFLALGIKLSYSAVSKHRDRAFYLKLQKEKLAAFEATLSSNAFEMDQRLQNKINKAEELITSIAKRFDKMEEKKEKEMEKKKKEEDKKIKRRCCREHKCFFVFCVV
ncbi:unnamed protein product [Cochlearia groenlandica]